MAVNELRSFPFTRIISINAPGPKHYLLLGNRLLTFLPLILAQHGLTNQVIFVTDTNVAETLWVNQLRQQTLPSLWPWVIVPSGEQYKTLATVHSLYNEFFQHGLDTTGVIVAVGGGVVGDMVGFAAATYMRGVRWVNVPTTLLAMIDASIGGKTGVDLPQGKNLVGAFHPPVLIVSDPEVLKTLPRAEHISALGEIIAHGIIGDVSLFEAIEARGDASQYFCTQLEQLQQTLEVKIRVVESDPFEKGERATLNLGHTIGHGIEAASEYRLRHGEAISIGIVAEAMLAERLGIAESGLAERVSRVVAAVGLPIRCPGLKPDRIRSMMNSDKKKVSGELKFALPARIGKVIWGIGVNDEILTQVLAEISWDFKE